MITIGSKWVNRTTGEIFTVIGYENAKNIIVKFECGYVTKTCSANVVSGKIKNPYYPRVHGVGYVGVGTHSRVSNKRAYSTWSNILKRCSVEKQTGRLASYKGCSVVDEWKNFQNFAEWYEAQPYKGDGFFIDKDILCIGNKIYGPTTCCLVPREINNVLVDAQNKNVCIQNVKESYYLRSKISGEYKHLGTFYTQEAANIAFKIAKEGEVKRLAEKYKSVLVEGAYKALMSWEVIK